MIHDQHMDAVAVYWLHCVSRRSRHTSHLSSIRLTYVRETTMKYDVLRTIPLNIYASQNENETLGKPCVFKKHAHCSSTAHDVASNTVVHISTLMFIHVTWNDTYIDHVLVKNNDFRNKAQLTRKSE